MPRSTGDQSTRLDTIGLDSMFGSFGQKYSANFPSVSFSSKQMTNQSLCSISLTFKISTYYQKVCVILIVIGHGRGPRAVADLFYFQAFQRDHGWFPQIFINRISPDWTNKQPAVDLDSCATQ